MTSKAVKCDHPLPEKPHRELRKQPRNGSSPIFLHVLAERVPRNLERGGRPREVLGVLQKDLPDVLADHLFEFIMDETFANPPRIGDKGRNLSFFHSPFHRRDEPLSTVRGSPSEVFRLPSMRHPVRTGRGLSRESVASPAHTRTHDRAPCGFGYRRMGYSPSNALEIQIVLRRRPSVTLRDVRRYRHRRAVHLADEAVLSPTGSAQPPK